MAGLEDLFRAGLEGGFGGGRRDPVMEAGKMTARQGGRGTAHLGDWRRRLGGAGGGGIMAEVVGNLPWD